MVSTSKIFGVSSCVFVLCLGLSYADAAHPKAETDMSNDRGSQGNQDLIKGDSTPPKDGQDEKVDETKLKEEKRSAKQEFDQRNAKGQDERSDRSKVPLRKLQDN